MPDSKHIQQDVYKVMTSLNVIHNADGVVVQGVGNQHGHCDCGPSQCVSASDCANDFVDVAPKVIRSEKDLWLHPDAISASNKQVKDITERFAEAIHTTTDSIL